MNIGNNGWDYRFADIEEISYYSSAQKYIDYIEDAYYEKRRKQEQFRLLFEDDQGNQAEALPLLRFTDRYHKRNLYKLWNIRNYIPCGFITLTTKEERDPGTYHRKMSKDWRKIWKQFTSYQRRYDNPLSYIRTFELTKSGTLHVHAVLYSRPDISVLQRNLIRSYKNWGYFKATMYNLKRYQRDGDTIYRVQSAKDSWIEEGHDGGVSSFEWLDMGEDYQRVPSFHYAQKYAFKEPNKRHQAILSYFGYRTYGIAGGVRNAISTIEPKGTMKLIDRYYV